MKKTTSLLLVTLLTIATITTLLITIINSVVLLSVTEEIEELNTSNEEMIVFLQDLVNRQIASTKESETALQGLSDSQVASDESEQTSQAKTPTSDEKPKEPEPKNGNLFVLGLYNNSFFNISLESTKTQANCVENPYLLPYDGYGPKRDLSFIASGDEIKTVYRVNKDFARQEGLSFNKVNGLYHIYYNMEYGSGDYFFEFTTTSDTVYYVGVRYYNP